MNLSTKQLIYGGLVSALFLCIPAFYNGSALIFPDSIGYIDGGFGNKPIEQRVWTYAGFVRHGSLAETLWSVIFLQALITVFSIYLVFKYLFKIKQGLYFVFYVLFISATTAVAFHCSRVMPDIFAPLLILQLSLLLFVPKMKKWDHLWAILILLFSLSTHNSHLIIALFSLVLLGIGGLFKSMRILYKESGLEWKAVVKVLAVMVSSFLLVCTLHWSVGGGFRATKGGSIFLFARLCDFHIAQDYLKETCEGEETKLCKEQDLRLGAYFLWLDLPSSIYNQGGWTDENEAIYGAAVKDMLTTPKYFFRYVLRTAESTLMQFFYIEYDPLAEVEEKYYGSGVKDYYRHYKVAIESSRQEINNYNKSDIAFKNSLQYVIFFLSLFLILVAFLTSKLPASIKLGTMFILLGLLINAFVVAATSGVYDRYQSRVAWLVTLPAFWLLLHFLENRKTQLLSRKP